LPSRVREIVPWFIDFWSLVMLWGCWVVTYRLPFSVPQLRLVALHFLLAFWLIQFRPVPSTW
jgi:hypothetical protein